MPLLHYYHRRALYVRQLLFWIAVCIYFSRARAFTASVIPNGAISLLTSSDCSSSAIAFLELDQSNGHLYISCIGPTGVRVIAIDRGWAFDLETSAITYTVLAENLTCTTSAPIKLAQSPDGLSRLFVSCIGVGIFSVASPSSNAPIMQFFPAAPCVSPTSLSVDVRTGTAYFVCYGFGVISIASNNSVSTLFRSKASTPCLSSQLTAAHYSPLHAALFIACSRGLLRLNTNGVNSTVELVSNRTCPFGEFEADDSGGNLFLLCSNGLLHCISTGGQLVSQYVDQMPVRMLAIDPSTRLLFSFSETMQAITVITVGSASIEYYLIRIPCLATSLLYLDTTAEFLVGCSSGDVLIVPTYSSVNLQSESFCPTMGGSANRIRINELTGSLYGLCPFSNALYSLTGGIYTNIAVPPSDAVDLYIDSEGGLFVSDSQHLFKVDSDSASVLLLMACLGDSVIADVSGASSNQLYVACRSAQLGSDAVDAIFVVQLYQTTFFATPLADSWWCQNAYSVSANPHTGEVYVACHGGDGSAHNGLLGGVLILNGTNKRTLFADDPSFPTPSKLIFNSSNNVLYIMGLSFILAVNMSALVTPFNISSPAIIYVFSLPDCDFIDFSIDSTSSDIYSLCVSAAFASSVQRFDGARLRLLSLPGDCVQPSSIAYNSRFKTLHLMCDATGLIAIAPLFVCYPGHYFAFDSCSRCPSGHFRNSSMLVPRSKCAPVPVGFFSADGADILPCLPGTVSNGQALQCTICPAGSIALEGIQCVNCPVGSYADKPGSVMCTPSPLGTFVGRNGSFFALPCQPGTFAPSVGYSSCLECSAGRVSATAWAASNCVNCSDNTYSPARSSVCISCSSSTWASVDHTACVSPYCSPGTGVLSSGRACSTCAANFYSSASKCLPCSINTYAPVPGSFVCLDSSSKSGLFCPGFGQAPVVQADYWAYLSVNMEEVSNFPTISGVGRVEYFTFPCPPGYCPGGTPSSLNATLSDATDFLTSLSLASQCAVDRDPDPMNVLCGRCKAGLYSSGSSCIPCDSTNALVIAIVVFFSSVYVFVIHKLSQQARSDSKILIMFAQTFIFQVGYDNNFLQWLGLFNFNLFQAGGRTCIAPLDAYEQHVLKALIPVVLLLEILIAFLAHTALFVRFPTRFSLAYRSLCGRYIRTVISLFNYGFLQVCAMCLTYLSCVRVGHASIVYSQPAIDCASDLYFQWRPLIVVLLVVFVVLYPFCLVAVLFHFRFRIGQDNPDVKQFLGVVYESYSPSVAWYWTPFLLVRQAALIVLNLSFQTDRSKRLLSFCYFNLFVLCLSDSKRPHRLAVENATEYAANILLLIMTCLMLSSGAGAVDSSTQILVSLLAIPFICFALCLIVLVRLPFPALHKRVGLLATAAAKPLDVDEDADPLGSLSSADRQLHRLTLSDNPVTRYIYSSRASVSRSAEDKGSLIQMTAEER